MAEEEEDSSETEKDSSDENDTSLYNELPDAVNQNELSDFLRSAYITYKLLFNPSKVSPPPDLFDFFK